MGMYATKETAEDSLSLDMGWLKKHGYLCGYKSGGIKWTFGFGGESSISFSVSATEGISANIRLWYSTKRWGDEERKSMDYSFPLIKVPCNLGGYRWAFQCGLWKNDQYCGRRVYTLYKANSDYFGCRKCMNIVYRSQRSCGGSFELFGKILDAEKKAEELSVEIWKWHYKGKPTKKVIKYFKLREKIPPVDYFEKIFNATFRV